MEELHEKLKAEVIEALDLKDVVPDDFNADTPLFIEGLGLDSIDALELIVLLEKGYGIRIEDPKERRKALYSIRTMAEYITFGNINMESVPEKYRISMEEPPGELKEPEQEHE
ncbi:MAG: acyl carrier protein [Bacteroidetes bacterium]|nr:acyl carrier protein [Bacteroidota bacterium]